MGNTQPIRWVLKKPKNKDKIRSPLYMGYLLSTAVRPYCMSLTTASPGSSSHFFSPLQGVPAIVTVSETYIFLPLSCNNSYFFIIRVLWDRFVFVCNGHHFKNLFNNVSLSFKKTCSTLFAWARTVGNLLQFNFFHNQECTDVSACSTTLFTSLTVFTLRARGNLPCIEKQKF